MFLAVINYLHIGKPVRTGMIRVCFQSLFTLRKKIKCFKVMFSASYFYIQPSPKLKRPRIWTFVVSVMARCQYQTVLCPSLQSNSPSTVWLAQCNASFVLDIACRRSNYVSNQYCKQTIHVGSIRSRVIILENPKDPMGTNVVFLYSSSSNVQSKLFGRQNARKRWSKSQPANILNMILNTSSSRALVKNCANCKQRLHCDGNEIVLVHLVAVTPCHLFFLSRTKIHTALTINCGSSWTELSIVVY